MMHISIIGDPNTATGFKLAGVENVYEATDAASARDAMKELSNDENTAVIIITERLAEELRDTIGEIESKKDIAPIIVEIPDREGKIVREIDPLQELIKRAIGVEIE
ncbi:MAG: V-type ATP synthase subunit F [Methanocellales archaeon]|nr:V-type ATP synthase subunit F [Methanocellales archaeon]